jgi:hypothetical protein
MKVHGSHYPTRQSGHSIRNHHTAGFIYSFVKEDADRREYSASKGFYSSTHIFLEFSGSFEVIIW